MILAEGPQARARAKKLAQGSDPGPRTGAQMTFLTPRWHDMISTARLYSWDCQYVQHSGTHAQRSICHAPLMYTRRSIKVYTLKVGLVKSRSRCKSQNPSLIVDLVESTVGSIEVDLVKLKADPASNDFRLPGSSQHPSSKVNLVKSRSRCQ